MTLTVKESDVDTIALPARLLETLRLSDGDQVTPSAAAGTLRLTRVDRFLALRGVLAEDDAFDQAMEGLDREWQVWNSTACV